MSSSCKVILEDNREYYSPGDAIRGKVVCYFKDTKDIRGIRLKLKGKEHTSWSERESYYDSSSKKTKHRTVHYHGDNSILRLETQLRGGGDVGRGTHEFPFHYVLPAVLPSSFVNGYGSIQYTIKATVDVPFKFDYEDEIVFRVISFINFNIDPPPIGPLEYSDEKTVCCLCCASGPITMDVTLQKKGFVVGEKAFVMVNIENMSNVNVEGVEARLGMTIISKVTSPSHKKKKDYELVASARGGGVGAHGQRNYNLELEIPQSTPVPNFNCATLFEQWCSLEIEAEISGCHTNLEISTDVVLGHIPLAPVQNVPPLYTQNADYNNDLPPPYSDDGLAPLPTAPSGSVGFNVAGVSPSICFPSLPPGSAPPDPFLPTPYPGSSNVPNAPPAEDVPSAPAKTEMADECSGFANVDDEKDKDARTSFQPPPSYNDAIKNLKPYPPM